jgi:hypothetical protein
LMKPNEVILCAVAVTVMKQNCIGKLGDRMPSSWVVETNTGAECLLVFCASEPFPPVYVATSDVSCSGKWQGAWQWR